MRRWIIPVLSLCVASFAFAAEIVDDPLAHLRAGHPRLLLTNDQLAVAVAAAQTDPLRAALHARIIATAEQVLTAPHAHLAPAGDPSLDQKRYAVHYILTCAMAYRLTHDERFLARAKSELHNAATFPDWTPKHFLDVGELSFAVALGYDWLYAQLTPAERAELKQALVEKSLSFVDRAYPATGKPARGLGWAGDTSNWNQVCNAGLLSAALTLADEEPDLARKAIAGVRRSLPHGMAAYAPDGEFPEGPGYWTYGTTYNVIALAELDTALGTDLGLTPAPGFRETANYQLAMQGPFGLAFNYADSTDDLQNSPACAWLAQHFGLATALHHTRALLVDELQRAKVTPFDPTVQGTVVNRFFVLHAIWYPTEPSATAADLPLDLHFRGVADLAVFRSGWNDPRALFVGFKAGENTEHHNHLDLGSFVLDADGVRWALDLGPDRYALPGYFDMVNQRWTYFRLNNRGHNTIAPGDALQARHVVAPIVAFGSTAARGFAVADLTSVYPGQMASLRRGIALLDRARVLVQDEYRATPVAPPLRWGLITKAKIDFAADHRSALLTANGRTLRAEILAPAAAQLRAEPARPPTAEENQNEGCSRLLIDLTPSAEPALARLAVLFTPVGERWPLLSPPTVKPLAEW